MNFTVIKGLVESLTLVQLRAAETALLAGEQPADNVPGNDPGEQLTHVLAASYIAERMATEGIHASIAIRDYAQRVRKTFG